MEYNTEFWEQVLEEYEADTNIGICYSSRIFSEAWDNPHVAKKIAELSMEWPELPNGTRVSMSGLLFRNAESEIIEDRQTRINFLNYLIKNKIEFQT